MKQSILTRRIALMSAIGSGFLALFALPAAAHHPFGGEAPKTIVEGLLSGVGHPVVGLDHLAFVIAVGLVAAVVRQGWWVPVAFVMATLAGTGIHLAGADLPAPEFIISLSVVVFGLLAVIQQRLNLMSVAVLAAAAGLFHGYAYGEAVVGAEPTPLVAYLIGFAVVQGAIACTTYLFSQRAINREKTAGLISVRHAGFAVLGAGAAFVGSLLV